MATTFETRYASSPQAVKKYDTQELRDEFLVPDLMQPGSIKWVYTHYDRYMAGGAVPTSEALILETIDPLKAEYFLERREVGVINAGGKGTIIADGEEFKMLHKDALYLGKGVKEVLEGIIDSQLTNDFWEITLPLDLATSSSTSPSLYAYYAAQYVIGANGLFSKLKVSDLLQEGLRSKKSALERHHLFPKAWLQRNGVPDQTQRNQIANYALVEWSDNIDISDNHPKEYLPNYVDRLTNHEKESMYYWHALPNNWEEMEYEEFLVQRRKLISQVVKDAYLKISS